MHGNTGLDAFKKIDETKDGNKDVDEEDTESEQKVRRPMISGQSFFHQCHQPNCACDFDEAKFIMSCTKYRDTERLIKGWTADAGE